MARDWAGTSVLFRRLTVEVGIGVLNADKNGFSRFRAKPVYRAKLSAVAAAAGRDERTIRRWRNEDDEYIKMVIAAVTERQLLKHSDKIKE